MHRSDRFECLDFDDEFTFDQQIDSIADISKLFAPVDDWDWNFGLHVKFSCS